MNQVIDRNKKKSGRPTKRTLEIEGKLEYAFSIGSSIVSACFYAGIAEATFHRWAEADQEFRERMRALKEKPILKALETINENLGDPKTAQWYLEKKHPDFKPKQSIQSTGTISVAGDILYRRNNRSE